MAELTLQTFAALFGATEQEIAQLAGDAIALLNPCYDVIEGRDRDRVLMEVLRRIHAPALKQAGSHRADDWEAGWRENLDEFRRTRDAKALVPRYVKPGVPIRLAGDFIKPAQPDFVYHYTQIFRSWLFRKYLADAKHVIEFGCGTGQNLVHLGQLFPDKRLTGCDWARSSQELLGEIRTSLGLDITGRHFDFFNPDSSIPVDGDTAVLTFGALEQLGANHGAYLDFILARRPAMCIDVVGIHELYDENDLIDYLGLLYHRRRNYLENYLTRIFALQDAGVVSVVSVHHHRFGNYFDDPYSYIVWRPK